MTKREGAILSAYTGCLLCDFNDFHKYIEELLGRPVFTHEIPELTEEIKERSRTDFITVMECQQ